MSKKRGPLALIIIDGWGYSASRDGNAIALAATPFYDELSEKYPSTLLEAHGSRVGLPAGVMGNSEVGHLNIGSGRVIRMDVSLVDHEIETGEFFRNAILTNTIDRARIAPRSLHLMGLVSDGQVHSSLTHLYALLKMAKDHALERVFIHCFLDGRDTPPSSAANYIATLQRKIDEIGIGQIASVVGRYYAMDRDKRWERVKKAYDLIVNGIGKHSKNAVKSIEESYAHNITDEFLEPIAMVDSYDKPLATIKENDVVIFFNFRTDRGRQLTEALSQKDFHEQNMHKLKLHYVTMTNYDETYENVNVVYNKDNITEFSGTTAKKLRALGYV